MSKAKRKASIKDLFRHWFVLRRLKNQSRRLAALKELRLLHKTVDISLGSDSIEQIKACTLSDPMSSVRVQAVLALGELHASVQAFLSDTDSKVRSKAVIVFTDQSIRSAGMVNATITDAIMVLERLAGDSDIEVRSAVKTAVNDLRQQRLKIARTRMDWKAAVEEWEQAILAANDAKVRISSIEVLKAQAIHSARMDYAKIADAITALEHLASDPVLGVRLAIKAAVSDLRQQRFKAARTRLDWKTEVDGWKQAANLNDIEELQRCLVALQWYHRKLGEDDADIDSRTQCARQIVARLASIAKGAAEQKDEDHGIVVGILAQFCNSISEWDVETQFMRVTESAPSTIVRSLQCLNSEIRNAIIRELHRQLDVEFTTWDVHELVDAVSAAIEDGNESIRVIATELLGRIGSPHACASLNKALMDDQVAVRMAAAIALQSCGSPAIEQLTGKLTHPDRSVREKAARVIGELGDNSANAALCRLLNDDDLQVRFSAARALHQCGWEAQGASERVDYHVAAANYMQAADEGALAVEPLVNVIEQYKKQSALAALVAIRDPGAVAPIMVPVFVDALKNNCNSQMADEIAESLSVISKAFPKVKSSITDPLLALMREGKYVAEIAYILGEPAIELLLNKISTARGMQETAQIVAAILKTRDTRMLPALALLVEAIVDSTRWYKDCAYGSPLHYYPLQVLANTLANLASHIDTEILQKVIAWSPRIVLQEEERSGDPYADLPSERDVVTEAWVYDCSKLIGPAQRELELRGVLESRGLTREPEKLGEKKRCPNCGFSYAWNGSSCGHCSF